MASNEVLPFEKLLSPISDDLPTGLPLRGDAELEDLYYQISGARDDARDAERAAKRAAMSQDTDDPQPASKGPPDWQAVVDLGTQIISEKSKDLWIAAWLIEGLARTDGFAGLRDGFRLIRELSERYWDRLHPRPDNPDGAQAAAADTSAPDAGQLGVDYLVAKLSGVFDGLLTTPINDFPITGSYPRDDSDATQRYAVSDYLRAQRLEALGDPDQRRRQIEAGAVSKEQIDEAVLATSRESFQCLLEDMEQCLAEHNAMSDLLDEKCGIDLAPPATKTREAISDCISTLKHIAEKKLAELPPSVEPGAEGAVATQEAGGNVTPVGGISNRDEAFQLLLKIADFFRENEPHSIVSYSLEQVVRWGRMSLPDLMSELIDNKDTREQSFRHTGVFLDDGESPPSG